MLTAPLYTCFAYDRYMCGLHAHINRTSRHCRCYAITCQTFRMSPSDRLEITVVYFNSIACKSDIQCFPFFWVLAWSGQLSKTQKGGKGVLGFVLSVSLCAASQLRLPLTLLVEIRTTFPAFMWFPRNCEKWKSWKSAHPWYSTTCFIKKFPLQFVLLHVFLFRWFTSDIYYMSVTRPIRWVAYQPVLGRYSLCIHICFVILIDRCRNSYLVNLMWHHQLEGCRGNEC